jgi:predicted ATPase
LLEVRFPKSAETTPEVLAQHYTAAGLNAQATDYRLRAGQRALERSVYAEAFSHLTRGIEALAALPETPERLHPELQLRTALGPTLMAVKG